MALSTKALCFAVTVEMKMSKLEIVPYAGVSKRTENLK